MDAPPNLPSAAQRGQLGEVLGLLADGVHVDSSVEAGRTALHLAARRGHEKIVEQLIANGAEINALTNEGFGGTPLDVADAKLAELLRKHGGKTADALK